MRKLILALLLYNAYHTNAQLLVAPATPANATNNYLSGCCGQISFACYWGAPEAWGVYEDLNNTNWQIGLNSGVVLTTGLRTNAPGPNTTPDKGVDLNRPGDTQLESTLSSFGFTGQTYDAACLEFDYLATVTGITSFRYVFASEEYPEFVGTQYNDVLAVYVSGPAIVGELNIATVPGNSTVMAINYFNGNTYPEQFNLNMDSSNGYLEYDGYSIPLFAKVYLEAGNKYHFKIKIADLGDGIYDSAVFIESNGIDTSTPDGVYINNPVKIYPNPTADAFMLEVNLLGSEKTDISIYDMAGRLIETLYNGEAPAGVNRLTSSVAHLPQGLYVVRTTIGKNTYTSKLAKNAF